MTASDAFSEYYAELLEKMARNKDRDQIWDIFQKFANVLISPHWSAYVLDDQYANLINGVDDRRKPLAIAHLKPSLLDGFASTTAIGACFNNSVLYQLWSSAGVKFHPHKAITKRLRYTKHDNVNYLPSAMQPRTIGPRISATKPSTALGRPWDTVWCAGSPRCLMGTNSCGWATRIRPTKSSMDVAIGSPTHPLD
jgi:hypothetical protein